MVIFHSFLMFFVCLPEGNNPYESQSHPHESQVPVRKKSPWLRRSVRNMVQMGKSQKKGASPAARVPHRQLSTFKNIADQKLITSMISHEDP